MARFSVKANTKKNTYDLIPEGPHVFKIMGVEYDETRGSVTVTMQTKNGSRHWENYYLLDFDGQPNPKAERAWFYFVRTVLGKSEEDQFDFDTDELLNRYVSADVEHTSYVAKRGAHAGETIEKEHLTNLQKADGFEGGYAEAVEGFDPLAGLDIFE